MVEQWPLLFTLQTSSPNKKRKKTDLFFCKNKLKEQLFLNDTYGFINKYHSVQWETHVLALLLLGQIIK